MLLYPSNTEMLCTDTTPNQPMTDLGSFDMEKRRDADATLTQMQMDS